MSSRSNVAAFLLRELRRASQASKRHWLAQKLPHASLGRPFRSLNAKDFGTNEPHLGGIGSLVARIRTPFVTKEADVFDIDVSCGSQKALPNYHSFAVLPSPGVPWKVANDW